VSVQYLLDTNVVSAYLKLPKLVHVATHSNDDVVKVRTRLDALPQPCFSVLTRWEIERELVHREMRRHLRAFRTFCLRSTILPVDDRVLTAAVAVWAACARAGRPVGDVDALLVATASAWGYTFVTGDGPALESAALQAPKVSTENWFSS
jgi:predicted nucleic acid-binding protein